MINQLWEEQFDKLAREREALYAERAKWGDKPVKCGATSLKARDIIVGSKEEVLAKLDSIILREHAKQYGGKRLQ